ncbi:MAG: OmpA family protein [Capsulimonadaceae bacterium]|nr:OmpA family protein [Capsulimonadaceae bacterium]
MARKRIHSGDHGNEERWLLTYSDMITLLVAFFIMMYAMSITNTAKFNSLAISVRNGFGNVAPNKPSILDGTGVGTPDEKIQPSMPKRSSTASAKGSGSDQTDKALATLRRLLESGDLANHVSVRREERGVVVTVIADKYTFDSGSADLKAGLKPVLDRIATVIQSEPNSIRIEGHTDDLPISNAHFASNWQLSAMRAANVLCYFVSADALSPDRVSCVGYADRRPIAANTSQESRAKNRRVEIVIQDSGKAAEGAGGEDGKASEGGGLINAWHVAPKFGGRA